MLTHMLPVGNTLKIFFKMSSSHKQINHMNTEYIQSTRIMRSMKFVQADIEIIQTTTANGYGV